MAVIRKTWTRNVYKKIPAAFPQAVTSQDQCKCNRLLKRKRLSEVVTMTHHSLMLKSSTGSDETSSVLHFPWCITDWGLYFKTSWGRNFKGADSSGFITDIVKVSYVDSLWAYSDWSVDMEKDNFHAVCLSWHTPTNGHESVRPATWPSSQPKQPPHTCWTNPPGTSNSLAPLLTLIFVV